MYPFIPPVHPGILKLVNPTTQYDIVITNMIHNEEVRNFQSYQLIQLALVQKLLEVVEDKYLSTLWKRITGQILLNIRDLILHVFRVCNKINPQQLKSKYDAVEAVSYSIDELIGVILSAVEDLIEIRELVGRPYSPQQVVNLGYLIISKHRIFRFDIR